MSEGPHVFPLLSQNISHFPEPGNSFPSLAGTSFRGPESGFREAPLKKKLRGGRPVDTPTRTPPYRDPGHTTTQDTGLPTPDNRHPDPNPHYALSNN